MSDCNNIVPKDILRWKTYRLRFRRTLDTTWHGNQWEDVPSREQATPLIHPHQLLVRKDVSQEEEIIVLS